MRRGDDVIDVVDDVVGHRLIVENGNENLGVAEICVTARNDISMMRKVRKRANGFWALLF